eukprot:5636167-Amphidinium_carterae.1
MDHDGYGLHILENNLVVTQCCSADCTAHHCARQAEVFHESAGQVVYRQGSAIVRRAFKNPLQVTGPANQ